jgi:hypothetical protein
MKTNIDWSTYKFRASQSYLLATGTIGLTDLQREELVGYVSRKASASMGEIDDNGKKIAPLTSNMESKMQELIEKDKDKSLPKTIVTELRKIHRAETFNRNFVFTNAYIQHGLNEEQEATTVYQKYREEVLGIKGIFIENQERFYNDYYSGLPDIFDTPLVEKRKEGFDTKCSWSLSTFPFKGDDLIPQYEWQNQVYMNLTGLKKWTTAYVLVNHSEDSVHKEKMKWFYFLKKNGYFPNEEDADEKYKLEYIEKCREIEKMMIFDIERFVEVNPYHELTISKEEWFGEGYDIPLKDRVVEKVSVYDPEKIKYLNERVKLSREYLKSLNDV